MNKECTKSKWPFMGCKFEARYDLIEKMNETPTFKGSVFAETCSATINSLKTKDKLYVCDVCVRCGFQIKRP